MSSRLPRVLLSLVVISLACASLAPSHAATPDTGTVTPASAMLAYTGGPFDNVNQTGTPDTPAGPGTPPLCSDPLLPCDDFALTVEIPPADPHVYFVRVQLSFTRPQADLDLYLLDSEGNDVKHSIGGAGAQESVQVLAAPGTSSFTVRVVPFDVTTGAGGDTYSATVTLTELVVPPEPPLQPTVPGVPRYEVLVPPPALGNSAGEPTLGINSDNGRVMYAAGLQTLRVSFDDCASPAGSLWEDKSFTTTSTASLDPIVFTDQLTNRTFVSQLTGACSSTAFTDDDGDNYTPGEGCGTPAGADHQSFGGGPFAPGPIGPTTDYPHAVYYCSQTPNVGAICALSRDGGLTFGPGVPAWNQTQCGGLHGHIKVHTNGTVYLPIRSCAGNVAGVGRSLDNGTTWTVHPVTGSTAPKNNALTDPSIGIGTEGRIYFGYQRSDGRPWIAVSDDGGVGWQHNQQIGAELGIENIVFPAVVAGDNDRAAFAFLGTTTAGDYQAAGTFNASWHLYVAHTYDGGVSWTVVDATPNDPVQRGSICNRGINCANVPDDRNLLDFIDIAMDAEGRAVVAFADGCLTSTCIIGGLNDFAAKAKLARQSGGLRLLSEFDPDPAEPVAPRPPRLAGYRSAPSVVHLSWSAPDNGGDDLTGYRIFRGTASGGATFLNSTGLKPTYNDITAEPGTAYFYQIRATNDAGEGLACGELAIPADPNPPADACSVPGIQVAADESDTLPAPAAATDVRLLYVAEPYFFDESEKLVFTLQVAEATGAPPSSQWYIIWDRPNPDANADRNYVAMKTDVLGAIGFEYGRISPPSVNAPTALGSADAGSYDAATGTIRISISNGLVDGVAAGQTLSGLHVRTFLNRPDGLPVTQAAATDFSPVGSYVLAGNAACRPNAAPTAVLDADPLAGCEPLTVEFDASQSVDTDPGDTIATYQFDFGDGTPAVVQASPSVAHEYASAGDFGARLLVTDSRGKESQNVALRVIGVQPSAAPPEVSPLEWTATKDALSWVEVENAAAYRVYRGVPAGLPALLDASPDSCLRFEGTTTSTGPVLGEIPGETEGNLYWYLVVGTGCSGDGPAGDATSGSRSVDPTGACP